MKKYILSLVGATMSLTAISQQSPSSVARGVELFESENYVASLPLLERGMNEINANDQLSRSKIDYYITICRSYLSNNAIGELSSYLKSNPSTPFMSDVLFRLGMLYSESANTGDAIQYFKRVDIAGLDSDYHQEYYFTYGYSLFIAGDYSAAKDLLLKAEELDGKYQTQSSYYIGYIDYKNQNYAQAKERLASLESNLFDQTLPFMLLHIEYIEKNYPYVAQNGKSLVDAAPEQSQSAIVQMVAQSLFKTEQYSQAIEYMELYEALGGELSVEDNYLMGYSLYINGRYSDAIPYLNAATSADGAIAQNSYYHLGGCYAHKGEMEAALSAFSMAHSLAHDPVIREDAQYNLIKLQYELSGSSPLLDRQIATITDYLSRYPQSTHKQELESILIDSYVNSKDYKSAFDAVMATKSTDGRVRMARGKIAYMRGVELYLAGDYDGAAQMFDVSIANPASARYSALSKFWKAEVTYSKGEYDRAATLYKDYVAVAPKSAAEYPLALYNLGYCYFSRSFSEDAKIWFERFVDSGSSNKELMADSYNRLGDIALSQREYADAIDDYTKALSNDPASSYSKFQQAIAYGLKPDKARKQAILSQMIADPQSERRDEAMLELANSYISSGDYRKGADMLLRLKDEVPSSPLMAQAFSQLAVAFQNLGRDDDAISYYKQVVENYPQSPQAKGAMVGLRSIYTASGDVSQYLAFAQSVGVDTNSSGEREQLLYSVAQRAYGSGEYANAIERYHSYLDEYPNGENAAVATYSLADSYKRTGDDSGALNHYLLVAAMSQNNYSARSVQYAGELLMKASEWEQAYHILRSMPTLSTDKRLIAKADHMALEAAIKLDDRAKCEIVAAQIISDRNASAVAKNLAYLTRGSYYLADKNFAAAISDLSKSSKELNTLTGAQSKYLLAKAYFFDGDTAKGEKEILDFSKRGTSHRDVLARAFILLGDIYMFRGDSFQAKATYQSVVDGYDGSDVTIKEEATNKRNQIKDNE